MSQNTRFVAIVSLGIGTLLGVATMTAVVRTPQPLTNGSADDVERSKGLTVGQLATYCRLPDNHVGAIYCTGFVAGVMDSSDVAPCLPSEWNARMARTFFLTWADRHPETLGDPASAGVVQAHRSALNCTRPGQGV